MNPGQITIIIPAPQFNPRLPALEALASCGLDKTRYQILVAEGNNPSRQRNLAAPKAHGEFLLFLDCDSQVDRDYFARLEKHIQSVEFDVLGGPALLPPGSPTLQQTFHAALAHPLVSGPGAARYIPRGSLRRSDERELILCNLAVRADFFQKTGGFNESLYPNEENEWLDRAPKQTRIYYDPDLRVHRPQRETWAAFAHMLLRYGIGRTRQFLVSLRPSAKQLPPLLLLAWLVATVIHPQLALLAAILFAAVFIPLIAATIPLPHDTSPAGQRAAAAPTIGTGIAALCLLLFYSLGQIVGFFTALFSHPSKVEIHIVNETGERVN